MKQIIAAIFVCVAFSAFVNAAQRKIAYDRGKNILVADADGTHSKKIADGAWPEISPDGTRVAFNTEGDAKNRPGPERHTLQSPTSPAAKSRFCQIFRATIVSVLSGRPMENSSLFQLWQTMRGTSAC